MIFDIEIDGAARTVAVESDAPGRYRVVIDGVAHQVHAERAGEFGLSLGISPSGGDASKPGRELQIAPGAAKGELLVTLGGRTVPVVVNGRSRRGAHRPRPAAPGGSRSSRRCRDGSSACW